MNASAESTFIFLACTILGAEKPAPADTLYLKNGMYIVVTPGRMARSITG